MKVGAIEVSDDARFSGRLVCPNCGDTKFGSTAMQDGSLIRTCHGSPDDEEPCAFQWPATDDHLYFHLPLAFILTKVPSV